LDIIFADPCAVEILDAVKTAQAAAAREVAGNSRRGSHTAFCRRSYTSGVAAV